MDKESLTRAANGHLTLEFKGSEFPDKLLRREGFTRQGPHIGSHLEMIVPDYVRGSLRLKAGHDVDSGSYLLAQDEEGDAFLTRLANQIAQQGGPADAGTSVPRG